jgi:hypothetical protein
MLFVPIELAVMGMMALTLLIIVSVWAVAVPDVIAEKGS